MTSQMKKVVVSRTTRGLEVHVPGVPGWEGFDQLTRYLEKHFSAVVLSTVDGPDARLRRLRVQDLELFLDYEDPFGNTIVAADPESALLRAIAEDLTRRLNER